MSAARYRTLDGDEVELPLAMDCWIIVPRALARFDPELAWTLDYEDAPEPDDADPRLDFSAGALLVPVERWNEQAELEPNLAPCDHAPAISAPTPTARATSTPSREEGSLADSVAAVAARSVGLAIAALATAYVLAVGAWLWTLRDGISGPEVSTGLVLVGVAVALAWLAGLAGIAWASPGSSRLRRSWPTLRAAVLHVTDDPLAILRAGMALQLSGFAFLVILR
jgi:hypothetical protein